MATGAIQIKGLAELQKHLGKSKSIISKFFQVAIARATMLMLRDLKTGGYVPVDTGRLKQSIRPRIGVLSSIIEPHVNYALYVHEGTRFQKKQPFFKVAIDRNKSKVEKEFEGAIAKIVKELAK